MAGSSLGRCIVEIIAAEIQHSGNLHLFVSVESSVLDFCVSGETVVEIYLQLVDVIVDKFGEKDY